MNKIPTNIKILMTAMFLFAGLIIASIFLNIGSIGSLGANLSEIVKNENTENQKNSNGINGNSCSDIDSDGLCDNEEPIYRTDPLNPDTDADGFLDGEEVASGHNPTMPGPDDFLPITNNPQAINITDKISTLMVGGFYAGDLSASADPETYNKALADISAEMLLDGIKTLNPNNIKIDETNFSSDSKEAQEKYINSIGSIIQIDLWGGLVNEPRLVVNKLTNFDTENQQNIADSQQYFNSKAIYYKKVISKVNSVPVPPSWIGIHKQILSNLQTLSINHEALSQTSEDPLKSIFAINNLMSVYKNVQPILVSITQKIKENNLNPPNSQLWTLINSLTDGF